MNIEPIQSFLGEKKRETLSVFVVVVAEEYFSL